MGETVNEFRNIVLSRHLNSELMMNGFIINYFFKINLDNIDIRNTFNDIILEKISFQKKIEIVKVIIDNPKYNKKLKEDYTNLIIKKGKPFSIILVDGSELPIKKVIDGLRMTNDIRNHLVHHLVTDPSSFKEPEVQRLYTNSRSNMNYRGDLNKFNKAFDEILKFFTSLRYSELTLFGP